MALTTETTTIGSHTFDVTRLPTTDALLLFERLLGLLGPTLGKALAGYKPGKPLLDQDANIAQAVAEAANGLSQPRALVELGQALLESTVVHMGKQKLQLADQYETLFAGELDVWVGWVWFCLKVNFPRFLAIADTLKGAVAAAQAAPADSEQ